MRINLPADLRAFVQEKVENGRYRTPEDAINDGLRLLKEQDQAEFDRLSALLKSRMKDSKRGKSIPFDTKLRGQIRERGLRRLAQLRNARS